MDDFVLSLDTSSSYSLDRIKKLLKDLGDPQEKFKTIHVAGTSGKTSTAYYISSMLKEAGYKTGLSVSPHVDEVNERLQINLIPLEEQVFCREFNEFIKILNVLSIKPTYFELLVAFAYWYFAKVEVDYAVVEVGLGGLLDGTNVIKRPDKICVITDVGLDHSEILGSTLSEVAYQKAGIIQPGNQVFTYRQDREIIKAIEGQTSIKKAKLNIINFQEDLIADSLPVFQKRNWFLSKSVCEFIFDQTNTRLTEQKWRVTTQTIIPGRLEVINYKDKKIILDGAHNFQKMRAFVESFEKKFPKASPVILLSVTENKDLYLEEMSAELKKISSRVVISSFEDKQDVLKKSIDAKIVAGYFVGSKVTIQNNLVDATKQLLNSDHKLIVVTGSLYFVRAVRKIIKNLL